MALLRSKSRGRHSLSIALLWLVSSLVLVQGQGNGNGNGNNGGGSSTSAPTLSPVEATTTTTVAATSDPTAKPTSSPTIPATPIEFPINLSKFSCASSGAVDTPGEPVHLTAISTGNGDKTVLLAPLEPGENGRMCIFSRWSLGQVQQSQGKGHYHPLGRSVPDVSNGDWTKPPGRPARELDYVCGVASNNGAEFSEGEYLCQVTLPWTKTVHADFSSTPIFAPYYLTYFERTSSVRNEISRFLHKTTFGPTSQELDALEAAHANIMATGLSSSDAMAQLQIEWTEAQMDPSTFTSGTFSSLRKYWRQRVNARAFEVYRIGESGPAPCEEHSRWRKFAFTKYDVQNARYLRWGDDGVTTQLQKPHKVTIETVDLRAPTGPPVSAPTPLPVNSPTLSPVIAPSFNPTVSSAPTGINILGYGDFEIDPSQDNTTNAINAAWASSCETSLVSVSDSPADVYSGSLSYSVTGGRCSVLRMMGANCPATRMTTELQAGDTIKISLWVKMAEAAQVFQMFTAHYHPRKAGRWARPTDDSHVISRTLIDNANKWKYIEAYHTVGDDWTFEGEILTPKLCNHYQLRFNLAASTASYIMDGVKIEKVSSPSEAEKQIAFLRNPGFAFSHKMWKMSSSSGTNIYDDDLGQNVMQIKKGQVVRQEVSQSAIPGEKYSFGFWVKLLNSNRDVTLKVILRMRFQNNDRMYGPCKNPICNLYERPVRTTIAAGSEAWKHITADDFEMYGNYTTWDGKVDFILFQVTTQGMPNSGSLRIANFHDLKQDSVPPSLSLVPSYAPTTLHVEDVAYIVRYAGLVRTVMKHPFQIDSTGEVLPMDGSVEYSLCDVEETEGSLSNLTKGLGFIVDGRCTNIRGGNPSVDLDPRYLNMTGLHILDLSDPDVTKIEAINLDQTHGGDLLLQSAVQDDVCDTFPSPYDNDYRGANEENPDATPNRFNPDAPVFALLPDGSYALYDPRIILRENTLDNPLMDGGGGVVLRSTLRAKNGFNSTQRGSTADYYTSNDHNIVLCANEHPNFINRDHCVLSYEENACIVEQPHYIDEKQRHTNVNVQITLKFDNETLSKIHNATASSFREANATANITKVDNRIYVYAVSNLRYDEWNTNGSYPLPCLDGNPRSRWVPRQDLDTTSCINTLQDASTAALAKAISNSNDQNVFLRDIYLWNSVAEDGCDAADSLEYGMLIMTDEGCWQNVHPDHLSIYDFTNYVSEHPSSNPDTDISITGFANNGILEYPDNHPMSYFEALKNVVGNDLTNIITPIARYGDLMIVDEFASLTGINSDPVALTAVAELGELKLNNAINKNRGGGVLVCGSPNEVGPDPTLDDYFDVLHADLNCVGCQKSYGNYFGQKQTVWAINAIESEDQLCGRMAWALYELVNVGTTTAPDNTESNLFTYDIFQRHCFGNYFDILKEMSYNPKMGEQFGYVMSTSTRYRYDRERDLVYPDENYAREVMQLYTIGLHFLNDDGTETRDTFGRVTQTYTNNDILSNSRIWSGFEYTARRGNVEELFRANKSRQDPMRIIVDRHDFFPKLTLGSWIGERYPLCADLPNKAFLKAGAQYHLRGGSNIPSLQSMSEAWDGDEAVKRLILSPSSSLYNKLCNADANGSCQYLNTVLIDENIPCDGKECRVDTLVIVQVAPGVFYEYVRQPCVHKVFYDNPKKVVSGFDWVLGTTWQYSHAMCADPMTASAARSCCDSDKVATFNHKLEFHGERVSFATNEAQCISDGLSVCDPSQIIAEEPSTISTAPYNFGYPSTNTFYWTDAACTQYIKVRNDGMIAIVNDFVKNVDVAGEDVVPFVSLEDSVTFITMPWNQDVFTLDYLYPSSEDNSCDNGACSILDDGSCLCPVTVSETAVFDSLPNRTEVLSSLLVGAFDPTLYSDSSTPYSLVDSSSEVKVYSSGSIGETSTIFKVTDEYGEILFLKNTRMNITIGNSYTMRNPLSFMNLAKVDELDATYEVDAFLKYLMRHSNTPAFVSKKLIQYLSTSNPTPDYAQRVTQAFKQGLFSKSGVTFGDGTYGNLAAVAAAIILDSEALNSVIEEDPINGNVREPLLKVIQALRSLSFTRRSEVKLSNGILKDLAWKVGQMVFQPPDQFSFFSSDYSPPGFFTDLDMVSPESELLSMNSVVGMTNGFFSLINFGLSNADGGFGPFISTDRVIGDYSSSVGQITYQVDGADISAKIDDLDTIMTGGRLSIENKEVLTNAYSYFLEAHGTETADRALMALTLASPEFHTSSTLKKTGAKREVTQPATKSSESYKAIVYIYLSGGIDSFNLLAPHSDGGCYLYDDYYQARGGAAGVGLTIDDMLTIDGSSAGIEGCSTFGINKLMSSYKEIYDEGKGIFLANMGHLHKPVSKNNWMTETRTDLFSHHTMKKEAQFVDAFREGAGPGVLGRMCDIFEDYGHAVSATSVNVQTPMVDGDPSKGRYADAMSTEGLPKIFDRQFLNGRTGQEFRLFLEELNSETTGQTSGVMSNLWSQRFIDVWSKTDQLVQTMRGTTLQTAFAQNGPDIGSINQQLKLVAQLMVNRDKRGNGVNRDVFYVEMGGFDTHSEMSDILKNKLPALNRAVGNFWAEIKAQGIVDSVTVIQGSEFGRTISANSNAGTDHGWGGNYFMFGGGVAGGKILGEYPTTFNDSGSQNIGRGRLIPSRPWDSLWYGVTQWFGISHQTDIDYVLPNSQNHGCSLFTDKDLYVAGTNEIQGCGGPKIESPANMEITEPRQLTGEEQKGLCKIATTAASKQLGINPADTRCFIADQVVTPSTGRRRLEGEEVMYTVSGVAQLNFDASIPPALANPSRINDIMTIASKTASDRVVVGAVPRTEAPSVSPSMMPSMSSAPSTETAEPTRAPVTPLGLPFSSADIGYCAYDGESYESANGLYNLKGSGDDIWGTEDAFHYMYVETSGDADVAIFIENFSNIDPWAKAGVMFRSSLAKDSAHYSAFLTGDNGVAQQVRRYNSYLSENKNIASIDPFNPSAKFVKITGSGYRNLNLLEVQIFDLDNINKALSTSGASASASSTYLWSGETPCPASIAIDGNTAEQAGITCDGNFHTNTETDPWLLIDLGAPVKINNIVIWNRVVCCTENLSGATVSLLDENSIVVGQVDLGDTTNLQTVQLNINDFSIPSGIWMRVTKVGNVMTAYYKEAHSLFWKPFGNQLSLPSINSNGYYIGVAITSHDNSNPQMANMQVSNVDLYRVCTNEAITPEQCDQATNCELGLRTETCYDAGYVKTRRVKIHLPRTDYLHLAEISVLNEYGENVALYKNAMMSSVYDPHYFPYPGDGVDGLIVDSMFHTNIEQNPWWQVDLEELAEVKEVVIYNRNFDCDITCQARANGAIVSLIDNKGRVFDTREVGVAAQGRRRLQTTGPQPIGLTFTPKPMGSFLSLAKKIKIQLQDTNYLHLNEVQVFDESGVNRALNKPSSMSSIYDSYAADESAGQGVDGLTSNFFHTDIEYGAWWEVDLVDPVHVKQIVLHNAILDQYGQDCSVCKKRLSNAVVSLIDSTGDVYDQKNVGDTTGVTELILNFVETKKSVLPPKELEAPGYFEYFGGGWCRDSEEKMYDYFRYYIDGVTPQVCQDKCSLRFSGLRGISTYSSYYCYCWYENGELPYPLPSDVHAYSQNHLGTGEVTMTLNEQDGDCYQFFENVVDTQTPTLVPSISPTPLPTKAPTRKPTKKPTSSPTQALAYTFIGNGWCKDSRFQYYDYVRFLEPNNTVERCAQYCPGKNDEASFRGISQYYSSANYCYCWYEDGTIPTTGYAYDYMYSGFTGVGEIVDFYATSYSTCYKFG